MKKSLVALALMGAFSGAAFAQSNVTLYGILDVNVQRNDPKAGNPCYAAVNGVGTPVSCETVTGVNSGHQSGNRWGIRGSEALGGGLSAVFNVEGGFSLDTGTLGQSTGANRLFGRQAWAGLQGNWGTFVAGRLAALSSGTGAFDMMGFIDPYATGFGDGGLQNTFTPLASLRVDNALGYISPTWGGFKFGGMYSFNAIGSEAAGSGNNTTVIDLAASWSSGPFAVAISYDIIDPANVVAGITNGAASQKNLMIGGTWDFKVVKLHLGYMDETKGWFRNNGSSIVVNAVDPGADATAWMVGATVPLFGGQLLGLYQTRDGDQINIGTAAAPVLREADLSIWSIRYTYPLSRRTNIYTYWSSKDGKKSLDKVADQDRNQFTLGIRHLF